MRCVRQTSLAHILLVFVAATSCTTLLLVLRCSPHGDEIGVQSHSQSHPQLEQHSSIKHAALAPNDSSTIRDEGHGLQQLESEAEQGILHTDENRRISAGSLLSGEHLKPINLPEVLNTHFYDTANLLIKPVLYNNEFEVVPFNRFTIDRLYPVDPGLGRRVIEKPIGYRKREMLSVIEYAINRLRETTGQTVSVSDFLEGIYRVVPSIGTQYELYFRDRSHYRKVIVGLPNTMAYSIREETVEPQKNTVHILLALSQRANAFRQFLQQLKDLLKEDSNVYVTVVYFGHTGLNDIQSLAKEFNANYDSDRVHLLETSGTFSRGQGLQIAVDALTNNPLLLLCDVDIILTHSFLERCRLHASPGRSVYYPIIFSLYNPDVISKLQETTGGVIHKPTISRDSGFWRDFGYGMTCQHRNDFLSVGGFRDEGNSEQSAAGWGLEDVRLYRKHLRAGRLTVIRATDPGIFHIWHEKSCPQGLSEDQYRGCLRSRALSEASQAQLGMLLLQNGHLRSGT